MGTTKTILTVNAGSSSIKLDIFRLEPDYPAQPMRTIQAQLTNIGQPQATLATHEVGEAPQVVQLDKLDQSAAIELLTDWLAETVAVETIYAVGHRLVHGGADFWQPTAITPENLEKLTSLAIFDPDHMPVALQLVQILQHTLPAATHVACFDTAFFHDLPRIAQQLPLPRHFEALGLRRYGFHGLSYSYLLGAFSKLAGEPAAKGRVIWAHLGSGASLAATSGGKPVDTTMGFSPASGIMMSSRTGDIDPGIVTFLQAQQAISPVAFDHLVNAESGLLGVSETSADMHHLLQLEATDSRAAEAVNLFVYQAKKAIGSLSTTLGGLDSLVFSGGIGEQSAVIRARICQDLDYLGIELDASRNVQAADCISVTGSPVGVHVIATDEAQVIAQQAAQLEQLSRGDLHDRHR